MKTRALFAVLFVVSGLFMNIPAAHAQLYSSEEYAQMTRLLDSLEAIPGDSLTLFCKNPGYYGGENPQYYGVMDTITVLFQEEHAEIIRSYWIFNWYPEQEITSFKKTKKGIWKSTKWVLRTGLTKTYESYRGTVRGEQASADDVIRQITDCEKL